MSRSTCIGGAGLLVQNAAHVSAALCDIASDTSSKHEIGVALYIDLFELLTGETIRSFRRGYDELKEQR